MFRRHSYFWLYTCKNITADTNRQFDMHTIACGIICHQNWRIGPSLGADITVEREFEIVKVFLDLKAILKNIVELYPQLVEF